MATAKFHNGHPHTVRIRVRSSDGQDVTACFVVMRGAMSQTPCKDEIPLHADIQLNESDLLKLGPPRLITMPKQERPRGLGDVVAKALSAVGIRKKKGCNCGKRQELLNRMIPFGGKK